MTVRPPAVAGSFYPADPDTLAAEVDRLIDRAASYDAEPSDGPLNIRPHALIVPHAGYRYSGPVAATAYRLLVPLRGQIATVVIFGPAHFSPILGMALPGCDAFGTPLGVVDVDEDISTRLAALPNIAVSPAAHQQEHSVEVQLPFLQRVLGEFRVVPLLVGPTPPEDVADAIESVIGGPVAIVVSTDLSHYHDQRTATALDERTAAAIEQNDANAIRSTDACGCDPLRGLLTVAHRRQWVMRRLDLRTSGDTAGDRSRVVGYGAFAAV